MFQLDVLLVDKQLAVGVPKYNGKYVLGAGEVIPNIKEESVARDAYYFALASHMGDRNEKWNSYVICDCETEVLFGVQGDEFYIRGEPYFYFWVAAYERFYRQEAVKLAKRRRLISDSGTMDTLEFVFQKLRDDQQIAFMSELEGIIESSSIEENATYLKEYSKQRNTLNPLIYGINPNVWGAGRNTMRWSAFFRFVRNNYNLEWDTFIKSITTVVIEPEVKTPTVMIGDRP